MNCPHCQTQNPSEAKFCMNCGKSLNITCSGCGKENPPQAKFCIHCGDELLSPAKPQEDPIHRLIPKAYAEKLEEAQKYQSMKGERRIVTILFCDVKGSTAMAEKLDPEEWAEIINQAFEFLISPIYKYEGTLARLMGDSVLAFFGAPIAHEDDAQRAILAGLDIINGIQPFREKIERRYDLDFNVRVGINTGLVVVGGVGSDLFMEYTALGDAINIAARMEQTAEPGTIQIAEDTYKKVAHFFDFESVTGLEIKGKRDPVQVYRVLQAKETPVYQRGIQGLEAPMIGRAVDLDQLKKILEDVKKGRGQIVSLIGEAGLGKSRLLREVRAVWEALELGVGAFGKLESRWNQVYGVSYESTRPYGIIQQLVRNFIGLSTSDTPEIIRKSLAETLRSTDFEISLQTLSLFETILGVKEHNNGNQLEGEELKIAIYRELSSTLDILVQQGPTVIAIDDLHWADQASTELITHLFQLTNRLPILFICSFRPDQLSPAWMVKQSAETNYTHRYTEITLSPLSKTDSNILVDELFSSKDLPSDVRTMILEKSDGNPFFMEEVIRTLIDNYVVTKDPDSRQLKVTSSIDEITIPDNLQALLGARIDRLEETAKYVLQLASVIGRSFQHQVLEIINDVAAELDNELNHLERMGLILEAGREPILEYAFRQALTQETAYNTILLKHRREFHLKVGEALLKIFPERVDEFAPVLAHHFYQAQDLRASDYYRQAGDSAAKLYANPEAISYYSQAIEALMWTDDIDLELLVYLYSCRGRAYELGSQFSKALDNYKELEELAREFNDDSIELKALIAQAQIYSIPSTAYNQEVGIDLLDKSMRMAEELDDQPALAKIFWIKTNLYRFHQNLDESQRFGEKAIALARELGLEEQLAYSLTDTAHTYNMSGKVVEAKDVSIEATELWRKLNNQPMLADCLAGLASIHVFSGEYDQAYVYSNEAYEISLKIENIWGQSYSRYAIGVVDFERGDIDLAIQHFTQSIKDAQLSQFLAGEIISKSFLSNLYAEFGHYQLANDTIGDMLGEGKVALGKSFFLGTQILTWVKAGKLDAAERLIEQEDVVMDQMNFFARHFYQLALCYLAFLKEDYTDAISQSKHLLQQLRSTRTEYLIPELLLLIAKSQIAMGMWDQAKISLEDAHKVAKNHGSRRTGWEVDYLLGRCALQNGNLEKANELFEQSKINIAYILENISNPDLKAHFINLDRVKQALDVVVEAP